MGVTTDNTSAVLPDWEPGFTLIVEGKDITALVQKNLVSLTLTDYGAGEKKSDEVSFAVVDDRLTLPAKGVKVTLSLGFGQQRISKGTFVVDSVASGASADSARIAQVTARAYSKSAAKGHGTLQSQKQRSWTNLTLGDLLHTVATEHGLTARIDAALAAKKLTHEDQSGESDMNLMTRLAARYGAVSKVTHDAWVVMPREATKTSKGNAIKKMTITPSQTSRWSYRNNSDHPDSSSAGSGTHVIRYHDLTDGGKIKSITVGSGQPVVHEEVTMFSLEAAKEIAGGLTTTSKKKLQQMNLEMPLTPELVGLTAQCRVTTRGFGSVEDREWHIGKAQFRISPQGFSLGLDLE
ncbi:contractile injection system protein, VgrG/Pvc8 family [Pantoea agglomerans]|uniref:contractile injection system protein, VgrG/Pvc8 family n=1 Tax=Enterobacter agglomerans TaxID=549 RepID=UPI0013B6CA45|nr:contractile injection system protein, VgrG/Pvc8 family [Pantoea agglomerans]NEG58174.1 late control protein [Pantoea agglomerans]NEG99887.1 late control protein [Pantoea agglomerans]NEH04150.1 late control protein [Pantoea agglomerans]NEH14447.1 late control protein [Pantoea agglomerans]